jgi:hypothetical protein
MGYGGPQRVSSFSIFIRRQSIDQELARLTKDLELTPEQQQQVRPLLEEHHDRIQALLDENPAASRQKLQSQSRKSRPPQFSPATDHTRV